MKDWKNYIERYHKGEMTPAEMHELEKKALYDPFLADALEGISIVSPSDLSSDVAELQGKIIPDRSRTFTPLRIAAGLVALLGVSLFLFWPSNDPTSLAVIPPAIPDSLKQQEITSASSEQLALTEQPKQDQTSISKSKVTKEKPTAVPITEAEVTDNTLAAMDSQTVVIDRTMSQLKTADSISPVVAERREIISSDKASAPSPVPGTIRLSGKVTIAEDGLPLPGANVSVKGTKTGTTTDRNGEYTIDVPADASLVFSFIGMQQSEVKANSTGNLDVKLAEDATQLSEVVITRAPIPQDDGETLLKLAEPVGGVRAYNRYMENNLQYPLQALNNDVKGRVIIQFDVGIDGSLSNFVVMKSVGHGCEDEVMRLVKEGPQWTPTTENAVAVESSVRVRMKFDAAKEKKKKKK